MTRNCVIPRRLTAFLLALMLLLTLTGALAQPAQTPLPEDVWGSDVYDPERPENLKDIDLQGASCIVMDMDTGRVLYDKAGETRRYPASTTKIMTLLLALEYGHLDEKVTIPQEAANIPSDSSKTPVTPGETMRFMDLLYALMLPSGNDAANAIAVIVGGSLDAFANMMNERAQQLGCADTHFVNPHGYHHENHYTTARDMALIASEGMRHPEFKTIVSTLYYTIPPTEIRAEPLKLTSHTDMLSGSSKFYYEPLVGIKTGYHSIAGQCFVGGAQKDGITLISVTFKGNKEGRWSDTIRLMEYGFARFNTYSYAQLYAKHPLTVEVQNFDPDDPLGGELTLALAPDNALQQSSVRILPEDFEARAQALSDVASLNLIQQLSAPIKQGDAVGTLQLTAFDGTPLSATLVAGRDVAEAPAPVQPDPTPMPTTPEDDSPNLDMLKAIGALLGILLLIILFLRVRAAQRRKRRRKQMQRRRAKQRKQPPRTMN